MIRPRGLWEYLGIIPQNHARAISICRIVAFWTFGRREDIPDFLTRLTSRVMKCTRYELTRSRLRIGVGFELTDTGYIPNDSPLQAQSSREDFNTFFVPIRWISQIRSAKGLRFFRIHELGITAATPRMSCPTIINPATQEKRPPAPNQP